MELARPNFGDATSSRYQSNLFCLEVLLERTLGQMSKYPLYPRISVDLLKIHWKSVGSKQLVK